MICKIGFTHKNCVRKKGLMLMVFLYLISLAKTSFVTVQTQQTCLRVNENSAVNLTCSFTDKQGNESDEVKVSWTHNSTLTRNNSNKEEGVYTTWNATSRTGQTVLSIPAVSKEQEGTYTCVVWISDSADYKKITLQIINSAQGGNVETTVENKTDTIRYTSTYNIFTLIIMLVSVLI
ncbi:immunoglobulin-like domain protein [Finch poxvirus]|uniref:Immunoglobulin-like domain protein n=1 Tax=Condorpox virus TaxID=3049970 RepID=A0AAT9UNS3_9POXV|nr:immunoglobulin-like domain protein [Finch poxvirus]UOX38961.1 immunoglobulin-like domain protein [Finch poxvirus]